MSRFDDLAFGTDRHRREPRVTHEHENLTGEVMEIGKMAVGGMITVGVIGALGSAFRRE